MATPNQIVLADLLATRPKELLQWKAEVLQYEMHIAQWYYLVNNQHYDVLTHILNHRSDWVGFVSKAVAVAAVCHQDTFILANFPQLKTDIEMNLHKANEPFDDCFLDIIQTHFVDQNPQINLSENLDEALRNRAQQKRLQSEVGHSILEKTALVSRKL